HRVELASEKSERAMCERQVSPGGEAVVARHDRYLRPFSQMPDCPGYPVAAHQLDVLVQDEHELPRRTAHPIVQGPGNPLVYRVLDNRRFSFLRGQELPDDGWKGVAAPIIHDDPFRRDIVLRGQGLERP